MAQLREREGRGKNDLRDEKSGAPVSGGGDELREPDVETKERKVVQRRKKGRSRRAGEQAMSLTDCRRERVSGRKRGKTALAMRRKIPNAVRRAQLCGGCEGVEHLTPVADLNGGRRGD